MVLQRDVDDGAVEQRHPRAEDGREHDAAARGRGVLDGPGAHAGDATSGPRSRPERAAPRSRRCRRRCRRASRRVHDVGQHQPDDHVDGGVEVAVVEVDAGTPRPVAAPPRSRPAAARRCGWSAAAAARSSAPYDAETTACSSALSGRARAHPARRARIASTRSSGCSSNAASTTARNFASSAGPSPRPAAASSRPRCRPSAARPHPVGELAHRDAGPPDLEGQRRRGRHHPLVHVSGLDGGGIGLSHAGSLGQPTCPGPAARIAAARSRPSRAPRSRGSTSSRGSPPTPCPAAKPSCSSPAATS